MSVLLGLPTPPPPHPAQEQTHGRDHTPHLGAKQESAHWVQAAGRVQAGAQQCRMAGSGDRGWQESGVVSPRGGQGRYPLCGPRWTLAISATLGRLPPKGLSVPFVTMMALDLVHP